VNDLRVQSPKVCVTYRIRVNVQVQVYISPKTNRILSRPPPREGVVVSESETNELRIGIIEAAGEAEGLEAGGGVLDDLAEFVVVEALGDGGGGGVYDEQDAAEVTRQNAGGDPAMMSLWRYLTLRI
jgi:hypothetical protein